MKVAIGTMICAAALLSAVPQTARAASQTATMQSDSSIDSAIATKINADDSLKDYNVSVSVKGGAATLSGTVRTTAQRAHAAELAKAAGATSVTNKIVVSSTAGPKGTTGKIEDKARATTDKVEDKTKAAASETKEGADKAWDATKSGSEKAWQKTKDGWEVVVDKTSSAAKAVGADITDAAITTTIHTKFVGEDALKGSDINVDTNNHTVTLKGTVASAAGRDRAVDIVKHTNGVDRIVDTLTVGPKR